MTTLEDSNKLNKLLLVIISILSLALVISFACYFMLSDCGVAVDDSVSVVEEDETPFYFIAIHNEPANGNPEQKEIISENFDLLERMINKADEYNIKLTLMFTPQWADYIVENDKLSYVKDWRENGHEIAVHHHSVYHGNWDGYTDYPKQEALDMREEKLRGTPEPYWGTLGDFMDVINQLGEGIVSGCVNDEADKNVMPDEIIYDTCSGFANFGDVGQRISDGTSIEKGINEYISVGYVDGVERKWLTHFQFYNKPIDQVMGVFDSLDSNTVYGFVVHSSDIRDQDIKYFGLLEDLHKRDAGGRQSMTVKEIMESGILEEKEIPQNLIDKNWDVNITNDEPRGKCGDYICDEFEKNNPDICPADCE